MTGLTNLQKLFLAGIEETEAERRARGVPLETEQLREWLGLPPVEEHKNAEAHKVKGK